MSNGAIGWIHLSGTALTPGAAALWDYRGGAQAQAEMAPPKVVVSMGLLSRRFSTSNLTLQSSSQYGPPPGRQASHQASHLGTPAQPFLAAKK